MPCSHSRWKDETKGPDGWGGGGCWWRRGGPAVLIAEDKFYILSPTYFFLNLHIMHNIYICMDIYLYILCLCVYMYIYMNMFVCICLYVH